MAVGKVLADRYEIQKLLGQGGMGAVYKAWDKSLKRTVAIKVMSGANVEEEDIKRFMQEGRISAALQHRNIVGFFDILSMDKLHAIVMEYVEGISFKEWLEEEAWPQGVTSLPANVRAGMMTGLVRSAMGRMGGKSKQSIDTLDQLPKAQQDGVTRVLKIFLDVCEALAYAHEKKIIHRDIKPENVMISKDGVVKLADFGLAKRQDSQSMKTLSGTIMGTPNYMSPEQASGQVHALDARSDIYSLCAVMYFAFTKTPPFQGETVYEILSRVVRDDPVPPETTNLGLPMDLSTIILKGLEKPVLNRYQAMVDLKSDIDRFLKGDTIAARPPGLMVKAYRKVRRSRKLQITCAAAALLIVGGFAAFVASSGARARAAQAALDKEQAEYADPILEAARDLAKDPPAALAKIDEAVNTAPRYANARNARCKMMYALGRPQKVLEDAQAVLDIAPENAQALYWKAMALQELDPEKNAEEVKSLLRLSAEKHSEKKLQEITLARLAFIETKYDEVLMRVNVALGMDKNLEEAYLLRGESYVRLGKTEEALRDFDNANRLNPSPAAWVARGSALAATGKDDEAFTAFDEALKLEPRHYEALYNRGRLHEFKGNPEGWAADWKAAIAAKPDHPDVPKIKEELKAKGFGDGSGAALPAVVANPGGTGAAPPANPAANPTAPPTGSASGGTSTPASAGAPDKPAAPSSGSPSAGTPPKPAGPAPKLAPQATRDEVIALLQSKEYEKAQKQLNTLVEKHAADPWLQWCYWRLMMRQAKRTEDVTNRKRLLKIAFDREQYWRNAQGFAPDDAAFADPFPQDDPIWQKIPRKS
jgi:tetratricopeptide (TPR) repeat protein/tRNA A-37 threonylcarbamoyl transferase component Bud32